MAQEGSNVRSVYLEKDHGILATDISNKLFIDCSTIDTATSPLVKDSIKEASPSASFYGAPVSGGVIGARKGTLAFFLGCAEDDPKLPVLNKIIEMMGEDSNTLWSTFVRAGGQAVEITISLGSSR